MKKFLLISLLLITTVTVVVYFNFSSFTKGIIENIASESLGVKVTIDEFDLSLANKSIAISGIKIANPEGFTKQNAIDLGKIKVSLGQLSKELISIKSIEISDTSIFLEVTENGTNLKKIADNAQSSASSKSTKQQTDGQSEQKKTPPKIIIEKFDITGSKITPKITLIQNKELGTINLPDIKLTDIGKKDNGILVEEAIAQIMEQLIKKAEQASYDAGLLEGVAKGALSGVLQSNGLAKDASDSFNKALGDADKFKQGLMNMLGK